MVKSPLKWHGGKQMMLSKLLPLVPKHTHYVEPFAGGLAMLLALDPEGRSEVANDLNCQLTDFWDVLRSESNFRRFKYLCEATPFSEVVYQESVYVLEQSADIVERAWAFFVNVRMSMSGRQTSFTPLTKRRTRRGMNEQASSWLSAVEGLSEVHARLRRVVITRRNALDLIEDEDTEHTFFYLDPPYLPETRTAPEVYEHEMSEAEHDLLLDRILTCKGKVMISGYENPLYDIRLGGWTKRFWDVANHSGSGETKQRRKECVWLNYE